MKGNVRAVGAIALSAAFLSCATSRRVVASLTANCHEVQPGVAFEMMRDNPRLLVLDVRHGQEFRHDLPHLRRAKEIPLSELPRRYGELEAWKSQSILIFSRDGTDAASACEFLARQDYRFVSHVTGGAEEWWRLGFGQSG